jgi:hypothetical protein
VFAATHQLITSLVHTRQALRAAIVETLAAFTVYRAYVVPGEPAPLASAREADHAAALAKTRPRPGCRPPTTPPSTSSATWRSDATGTAAGCARSSLSASSKPAGQ